MITLLTLIRATVDRGAIVALAVLMVLLLVISCAMTWADNKRK